MDVARAVLIHRGMWKASAVSFHSWLIIKFLNLPIAISGLERGREGKWRGNEGEGVWSKIYARKGRIFIYSLMNNKMRFTFKRINFLGEQEERRKGGENQEGSEDPGSVDIAQFPEGCQRRLCSTWLCPHKSIGKHLLLSTLKRTWKSKTDDS